MPSLCTLPPPRHPQMDRVYKEERNHILSLVKRIKATGCNVLLIQKSILRDAVTDLSLHYLVRVLWTPFPIFTTPYATHAVADSPLSSV